MAEVDLYQLLGVSRNASQDEIKRAYRALARELHPDANPGNASAEARFKEVSQAYEILSDPERRANYDRFGAEGAASGFQAGSVQDIFDMFFGAMGGQGAQRRRGPQYGPDAEISVEITLDDTVYGVTREVTLTLPSTCPTCSGSGAAPGTSPVTCVECAGLGEVRRVRNSILGQMVTSSPCPRCQGTGERIEKPCSTCRGDGRTNQEQVLTIEIPAGVENGSTMRLTGRGPAGPRGGPAGTLYVHLLVQDDERFERVGDDLHHEAHVAFTQAALGATITVPTVRSTATVDVEPGSANGTIIRLRDEGVAHLRGRGRGDLFVHLVVDVPTDLDEVAIDLLRQLAEHRGEELSEHHHGLLSRLRGAKR